MQPYGADGLRTSGEQIVLESPLPKDWTARVPKRLAHAEYPGTTVLWDGEYFEVISAEHCPGGGFRYVLEPWRDDHTIRRFVAYDEASETARLADHRAAARQRRRSLGASAAAIVLGHLPEPVQNDLANDLGIRPSRMTLVSCVPAVLLIGVLVWLDSEATMRLEPSPVPLVLWFFALAYLTESAARYFVAMSQDRGVGSLIGYVGYALIWLFHPNRRLLVPPFEVERGRGSFTLAPPAEIERRDILEMRGILLALLPPADQRALLERRGFDPRRYAAGPAWIMLLFCVLGAATSMSSLLEGSRVSAVLSLLVALLLGIDQVKRLLVLRQGRYAGSVLGPLIRPFVRHLLERG